MRSGQILKDIEEERDYKIAKIKMDEQNEQIRLSLIRDAYKETEDLSKEVTKNVKKNVQKYISSTNKVLEPMKYYKEFMDVYIDTLAKGRISDEEIKYIKTSFTDAQRKGKIEMEDLAPLMYIKYMVHGIKTKFELKHIVIDEAQDFSEFQFYIFKKQLKVIHLQYSEIWRKEYIFTEARTIGKNNEHSIWRWH